MPFQKGKSGNPGGRKPQQSSAKKLREAIAKDIPPIIRAMVKAAKDGDARAAKLLLDRAVPALKPRQQPEAIGDLTGSLTDQGRAVLAAMGTGKLSTDEAQNILSALASLARLQETDDIERRLAALEQNRGND